MKLQRQRKNRPGNAWPTWKLRAYLPEGWRRWEVLRLVQVGGSRGQRDWQLQTLAGRPAGVGLFASRDVALKWAKTRCDRVEVEPATPGNST